VKPGCLDATLSLIGDAFVLSIRSPILLERHTQGDKRRE
jgi:hypothetical protein